jgi:hypothetical protein
MSTINNNQRKGWIIYETNSCIRDPISSQMIPRIYKSIECDPTIRHYNEWIPGIYTIHSAKFVNNIDDVEKTIHKVFGDRKYIMSENYEKLSFFDGVSIEQFEASIKYIDGLMYDPSKTYPLDEENQTMFDFLRPMDTNMIPKKKKKYKPISSLTPEQQQIRRSKNREYSKNFRIKNPNYYNKKK